MRQKIFALVLLLLIAPASLIARGAEHKRLGAGIFIGEPIGYTGRFFFVDQLSLDLLVGYGFVEEAFVIQPSLLIHLRRILDYDDKDFSIVPFFGTGLKTGVDVAGRRDGEGLVALRFPLGFSVVLSDGVFEISAEFAPGAELSPQTTFDATGGIGLRYYFF